MAPFLNLQSPPTFGGFYTPAVSLAGLLIYLLFNHLKNKSRRLILPPKVPGLPVLGNLLQLKEKKPFKTFTQWAERYGPVYSIKTGASTMIVLNNTDVAKEAMVAKYSSISTRKLSNALKILTADKSIVAMSDYNDFYKSAKRNLLTSTLGPNAQKRNRIHRDTLIDNVCEQFAVHAKMQPSWEAVNFRDVFQSQLFGLSLKQAIGEDVQEIYVEELNRTFSRDEIFKTLVIDPLRGAIEVDWRDFFPYLKWIPNKGFEEKIRTMYENRRAVMKALIERQMKQIASGVEMKCYLDHLLSEAECVLSEQQLMMLVWEVIIESSDTTLVTTEWAMYELSKHPQIQSNLLMEIHKACGSNKLTEEKLCQLPYLAAVFHETLRLHSPAPIVPLRYVHEDTQLGGFFIPKGSEIAINIYGCNMDKKLWDHPEEWKPERFITGGEDTSELHKTMAFGAGKRVCAGALQAMLISCVAIGRFVQEFEWKLMEGEEENCDTLGLTTHKLHPMRAAIKLRS